MDRTLFIIVAVCMVCSWAATCSDDIYKCHVNYVESSMSRQDLDVYYSCVLRQTCVTDSEREEKEKSLNDITDLKCQSDLNSCFIQHGSSTDIDGTVKYISCLSRLSKCTDPTIAKMVETALNSANFHLHTLTQG
ncbi:hypothetical protein Btru_043639 [Bulinus truncatus]|nr:hypothetical protein Btru_043639 [Bulinus truncatus]